MVLLFFETLEGLVITMTVITRTFPQTNTFVFVSAFCARLDLALISSVRGGGLLLLVLLVPLIL